MKVVIVEDEAPAARHLTRLLHRYDHEIEVLAILGSVEDAVQWFSSHKEPDLVFLDIHLSDALGFKIFERVNLRVPLIFTTAYDQYALKAFQVNSIDYLLKPIDLEDLKHAFEKLDVLSGTAAESFFSTEQIQSAWQLLSRPYKTRFVAKIGERLKSVPVENIRQFYSKHKITYLLTSEGKSYPVDYSLSDIEDLVNPAEFFRVNRQIIVRAGAIEEVVAYSNSRLKIKVTGGRPDEIIVSRERVQDFKEWLDQ